MAILKLDDAGRINKFFEAEVKTMNNGIRSIKMNSQADALRHEMELSVIDSKIEDAEETVKDAYLAVSVEDIKSNDDMTRFSVKYWANIESKEAALEKLKEQRKADVEQYEKTLADRNAKIAKYEARIIKIS